ncbi:hypothetical protein H1R20_g891, partial [Candolleomyces eurysporus]
MAESTHSGRRGNRGPPDNPEYNTPIPSGAATPGTDGTPSGASRFKARVVERVDKAEESMQRMGKNVKRGVKTFLGIGKPKNQGEGATSAQDVAGSTVSASDGTNFTDRDGEAPVVEEVLSASQPDAASSSAKVGQPASPETGITSIVPKSVLDEDKAATMQGLVIDAGSAAVRPDDSSVAVKPEPLDTTSGAPLAHSAEPVPLSTPADNLQGTVPSFQSQATLPSVAKDDENKPLQEAMIVSTVSAPVLAEEGGSGRTTEEGIEGPPVPAPAMTRSTVKESTSDKESSKGWAIAKGTFKTVLGIAITLVPEPFKGPAEALLKVVDVVEMANSNKEEVKILKNRCDLLGSSIANAVQGKDLSEDLKESIGRLVVGILNTLEATNEEKSKGFTAYLLAEDDVEVLKNANKKLDELLEHFWIENHIAGTIVLSDILATVHVQGGWMQGLSATLDKHSENSALDRLKRIPGAAYDSQEVAAKVVSCFEGTRSTLLANVGRWMSGPVFDDHNPPLYVLDGIAGIGKSTVAITVAQRAARH